MCEAAQAREMISTSSSEGRPPLVPLQSSGVQGVPEPCCMEPLSFRACSRVATAQQAGTFFSCHPISFRKPTLLTSSFDRGLAELQALLAMLPQPRRRVAIYRLSRGLKSALLDRMQVQKCSLRMCDAMPPRSVPNKRRVVTPRLPSSNRRGCVSELPLGKKERGYIARITIEGIAVSSRCMKTREEAENLLHGLLARMEQAEDTNGPGSGLLEACRRVEEQWSYRVLVDARAWAGRVLSSRRLRSVGEAVALRKALDNARKQGWESLRSAWACCMSQSRCSAKNVNMTRLQILDRTRLAAEKRRKARAEARRESKIVRTERRLAVLVPRLERAGIAESKRADRFLRRMKKAPRHRVIDPIDTGCSLRDLRMLRGRSAQLPPMFNCMTIVEPKTCLDASNASALLLKYSSKEWQSHQQPSRIIPPPGINGQMVQNLARGSPPQTCKDA